MTVHAKRPGDTALPLPLDGTIPGALGDLFAGGPPDDAAITAFLTGTTFPIVMPGEAFFVFRGHADHVDLVRWIHAGIDRNSFRRVPGTDLWLLPMQVEDGGRFEYKLALHRDGHEEWILDPFNPVRAADPFGENSVCCTHGYSRPDWTTDQGAPQGRLVPVAVESETFEEVRQEQVYLPPHYDPDAHYPLVVIHDGDDFVTYANLSISLDNLIAAGDIPPVVAALVQTRDRMGEYPRGRRHARYVVRELLPVLQSQFALSARAVDRVMLGASLGAVASLSTAFRFPGCFGGLVLKSGSFILDERKLKAREHPVFHRVARLVKAFERAPQIEGVRAFVSTGELEGLADENRSLADFLRNKGVEVTFQSSWDGHHWHNWRDQLRDGLMWTLNRTDKRT